MQKIKLIIKKNMSKGKSEKIDYDKIWKKSDKLKTIYIYSISIINETFYIL